MLTKTDCILKQVDDSDLSYADFEYYSVKIMDFGLSKVIGPHDFTKEGYGSLCYTAPEIILKKQYQS
jgi:serine/threonine protein kinase